MMLLDNDKLQALEEEFDGHQNGIDIANFVALMKSAIPHQPEDKYELINGLVKVTNIKNQFQSYSEISISTETATWSGPNSPSTLSTLFLAKKKPNSSTLVSKKIGK